MSAARRIRVAIVSDATPERNGVGSYYTDLVNQLGKHRIDAQLFCPRGEGHGWRRYLMPPLPGDSTQRLWIPRPLKLLRQVREARPDAVVVPTPGPFGLIGLLAARRLRVPLIVGFHTHYEALAGIYWTDAFGRLCQRVLEWCNHVLFRGSTVVLANSPEMEQLASRMGARVVRRMGTSVALDFLERPAVPLRPQTRRLLFAGRLAEEKNLPEIIELARARPDISISIAGDGPLRETVLAAARELPNLEYLGWIQRRTLVDVIDSHDLLLLPSRVESFGTVALEAMARERPVIVSAACGIMAWADLAQGLYAMGPEENLTQAIDRIRALPASERSEKSRLARQAAARLNDWNLRNWLQWLGGPDPKAELDGLRV